MINYNTFKDKLQVLEEVRQILQQMIYDEFEVYKQIEQDRNRDEHDNINKNYHKGGYNIKLFPTKYGEVTLLIPKLYNPFSKFVPSILNICMPDVGGIVMDLYSRGLSIVDITQHLRKFHGFNKCTSSIEKYLEPMIKEYYDFQEKSLKYIKPEVLHCDCTYFSVMNKGVYSSRPLHVVTSKDKYGNETIIYAKLFTSESATSWIKVFNELNKRGMDAPQLIVIDGCKATPKAVKAIYPHCNIQRCLFHAVADLRRVLYKSCDRYKLKQITTRFFEREITFNQMIKEMYESFVDNHKEIRKIFKDPNLRTYQMYNEECWRDIQTNNCLESVNQNLKLTHAKHRAYKSDDGLHRAVIRQIKRTNKYYKSKASKDYKINKVHDEIEPLAKYEQIVKYKIEIEKTLNKRIIKYITIEEQQEILELLKIA